MIRKLLFLIYILMLNHCDIHGFQLKKVLVFSRHNLRAPLMQNLEKLSPKKWPEWSVGAGQLTPKGERLERYMGKYFSAWLNKEGLFENGSCPNSSVFFYSSNMNRTRATARAFSEAAFPKCNVSVYTKNVTFPQHDPVFPFTITNATESFLQTGNRDMQENLNQSNLSDVYEMLNKIADIPHSDLCKNERICDLNEGKDEVSFNFGGYPHITGRFMIAESLVDSFLMSLYEGFPLEEIGWGEIVDKSQWGLLSKMVNENMRIPYNLGVIRQYTRPLVKYMKKVMDDETLFTMMFGHDSNLSSLKFTMGFVPYTLPGQLELLPIGSKLVFQKWADGVNDYLKVEFVYPSTEQMINSEILSLSNPPKNITMHFKTLTAKENGMYSWSDFENLMNDLIQ